MDIQTACDIINGDPISGVGPRIVYKPDYVFHAQPYDYRIHGAILRTVSMPAPSTDREDARHGYAKIDLALLPVYVSPLVAARLGIPAPGSVPTPPAPAPVDYSDGYGGTYAKGE